MKRFASQKINAWYDAKDRLPLILTGTRQVGKTYLVREFARAQGLQLCELNFEENAALKNIFSGALDPETIVNEIMLKLGRAIAKTDLIFFDEAQDCPACLTALKYFAEKRPEQPVIVAGSFLGLSLAAASFPVGKVQCQWLGPLTFEEFLLGIGDELGAQALRAAVVQKSVTLNTHQHLMGQLRRYLVTGGMPKAVLQISGRAAGNLFEEMATVREVQLALVRDYQSDFSKHSGAANAAHIRAIFSNVPLQLAAHEDRTTGKYLFSHADLGSNKGYDRLRMPIDWLRQAGLLYRVRIVNKAALPLELYGQDNLFKLYCFDVGILGAQLRLPPERIFGDDYGQSRGYFAESMVLQALVRDEHTVPYCWGEGQAEIEFLTTINSEIVPIEVKAGHRTKARSLDSFIKKYHPKVAIKLQAGMFGYDPNRRLHSLPLYVAWDLYAMDLW